MHVRVRDTSGRTTFAIVLISLGVLWTLDSLGIMETAPVVRWWPVVIVVFGLSRLLGVGARPQVGAGAIITLIGAWLLGNSLDVLSVSLWDLWPLALVAVGVTMIVRSRERAAAAAAPALAGGQTAGGPDPAAQISHFAFWSGVTRMVTTPDFRGGDLSAIMGGIDLDLRGARVGPEPAVIDLLVIWGGVDLKVPEDWNVVTEATVVMGGIDHKGKVPPAGTRQTLILRGFVLMGGIEIKN